MSKAIDPVFQAAMRELLKHDFERNGKGYAGLELSVWGELLVECQAIRQGSPALRHRRKRSCRY